MLKVTKLSVGQQAYYEAQVARGRDDYYSGSGEAPGEFRGRLAAELGLEGRVSVPAFEALLAGNDPLDPDAERPLRDVAQASNVTAYDLTFSAPKSVSLLAAIAPADVSRELRDAHEAAVSAALDYIEDEAVRVRRGKGGKHVERADGLVSASYRHRMSRAKDPHLHTHVVTAALTRGADGRWTSLDARPLYLQAKAAGTLYQSHLRAEVVQRLGLSWGPVVKGLAELEGVDADVLDQFSQRRMAIKEAAKELGLDLDDLSIKEREQLALKTRQAKDEPQTAVEHGAWLDSIRARAAEHGLDAEAVDELLAGGSRELSGGDQGVTFGDITDRMAGPHGLTSMSNAFERRDAIVEVGSAAQQGAFGNELRGLVAEFEDRGDVLAVQGSELDPKWTTADLVACEQRLIAQAIGRAGEGAAQLDSEVVDRRLAEGERTLNPQQAAAVRGVVTSGNGVDVIEARAGTGKTYLAGALREVWEADEGRRVIGVAPTGAATRTLKDEAQIQSWTLHSILGEIERFGAIEQGTVVILDEAGMADTRHVEQLLAHCREAGVKLVAVGDSGQLPSVQAGGWLGAVGDRLGRHELTETLRQRDPQERRVLGALHAGTPEPYLQFAGDHDRLHVVGETADAAKAAIGAWERAVDEHGLGQAVLITRDNSMRRLLNREARERRADQLGERRDYGPVEVAEGDRIICRRNDRRQDVDNGTRGTVLHVAEDRVVLQTDAGTIRDLPAAYVSEHVEHAYALTGHGMQGGTVEWAGVVAQPSHLTRGWSYTALTRAKGDTQLYVVAGDTTAALDRRAERAEEGPEAAAGSVVDREAVLLRLADQMVVRDDEDLAVDQLPEPFVAAGSPADRDVIEAPGVEIPVQERGAEVASPRVPNEQQRLGDVVDEAMRLQAQRESLPVRELQELRALDEQRETARARRQLHAEELRGVPAPGRLRDPHAIERARLQALVAANDEHLAALAAQHAAAAAAMHETTGAEPEAVGAELRSIRERLHELDGERKELRGNIVDRAVQQPPAWVDRRLGERPAEESRALGVWQRGVRAGVRAQLDLDPRADLDAGLPETAPHGRDRQVWERGIQAVDQAADRLGRPTVTRGRDLGHDLH